MKLINSHATRLGFAAVVAASFALFAGDAAAQTAGTITLTGGTTASCQYSAMSVSPNGGITVTCGGTTAPVAPVCSNTTVSISTGGSATITSSCQNTPTSYSWAANGGAPAPASPSSLSTSVGPFASAGTYTYTLTASNAAGPTTATATVNVVAPTAVPTCSALTPGSASITTGSSTTLTATCDQGPTAYGWQATSTGSPAVPTSPTTSNQITVGPFTTPGTYSFTVLAANSLGTGVVTASATVTVADATSCPTVATVPSANGNNIYNLRYNLKPGQIGSTAFTWPMTDYPTATKIRMFTVKATTAESPGGLTHTVTISPCPGQMVPSPAACGMTGGNGGFTFTVGAGTSCPLTPGNTYYVNVKQTTSPTGTNTCTPSGLNGVNYCSSVVQGTPL